MSANTQHPGTTCSPTTACPMWPNTSAQNHLQCLTTPETCGALSRMSDWAPEACPRLQLIQQKQANAIAAKSIANSSPQLRCVNSKAISASTPEPSCSQRPSYSSTMSGNLGTQKCRERTSWLCVRRMRGMQTAPCAFHGFCADLRVAGNVSCTCPLRHKKRPPHQR